VFAFLRHMSSRPKPRPRTRSIRNGLNLTDQPEPGGSRRPGRRPHVPSSKPTMSKSRRASSPGSIQFRASVSRLEKARNERETLVRRPRPLLEWPYMCGPHMRQPGFCNFVAVRRSSGSECLSAHLAEL